jgi:hypothetical protein
MFERFFCMLCGGIGVALLAVIRRALGVLNSFTHVFIGRLGQHR